jgi:hypothetical protein
MDVSKPTKLYFDLMLVWSLFSLCSLKRLMLPFFGGQETIYTTMIGFEETL